MNLPKPPILIECEPTLATLIITGLLTLGLFLTAFAPAVSAQTVNAFVDRNIIQVGETVKFTIKWSGPNSGTSVNLEVLKKNFKILGTSQNNQIKMIEGRANITTELITILQPKHGGKLKIPSFQIGPYQTPPISLHVLHPSQPGQQKDNRGSFR